jgi:predicted RNase H-like HicB family nuclease
VVAFPDCPGCQVVASLEADAVARAKDALRHWLEERCLAGTPLPEPSAIIEVPIKGEVAWIVFSP